MSPAVRQEWFRNKHIIETGQAYGQCEIDKEGLERMGCLTNVISNSRSALFTSDARILTPNFIVNQICPSIRRTTKTLKRVKEP